MKGLKVKTEIMDSQHIEEKFLASFMELGPIWEELTWSTEVNCKKYIDICLRYFLDK